MQYKILIADDEDDIREIMAKKIAQEKYQVITAADGEEAWAKIKSESPDVILLDLNMPKMDGLEVLKKLRQNPPSAKWQPVIIISARNEVSDIHEGMAMEADHYLTKPCHIGEVLKAIQLMIGLIPQRKSALELQADAKEHTGGNEKKK